MVVFGSFCEKQQVASHAWFPELKLTLTLRRTESMATISQELYTDFSLNLYPISQHASCLFSINLAAEFMRLSPLWVYLTSCLEAPQETSSSYRFQSFEDELCLIHPISKTFYLGAIIQEPLYRLYAYQASDY